MRSRSLLLHGTAFALLILAAIFFIRSSGSPSSEKPEPLQASGAPLSSRASRSGPVSSAASPRRPHSGFGSSPSIVESSDPARLLSLSSYRSSSGVENRRRTLRSASSSFSKRHDASSSPAAHPGGASLGDTLVADGYLIEALGYEPSEEGEVLLVSVTPAGNPPQPVENPARRQTSGFTREEELFRSKWGWAAYDQALKAVNDPSLQETGR